MDTQKLHDLIDKVIGKKGPLRVPAYWMWEVLKSLISWVEHLVSKLELSISSKITSLEINLRNELDFYTRKPSKYTYEELKKLAAEGSLKVGQTYILTDYVASLGYFANYLVKDIEPTVTNNPRINEIHLTARTSYEFNLPVKGFISSSNPAVSLAFEGQFHFSRYTVSFNPLSWVLLGGENCIITGRWGTAQKPISDEEDTLTFDRFDLDIDTSIGNTVAAIFKDTKDNEFILYTSIDNRDFRDSSHKIYFRVSGPTIDGVTCSYFHYTKLEDPFKGIFSEFSIPSRNIHFPYDPLGYRFEVHGTVYTSSIIEGYITGFENLPEFSPCYNIRVSPYFIYNKNNDKAPYAPWSYKNVQILNGIVTRNVSNVEVTGNSYNCIFVKQVGSSSYYQVNFKASVFASSDIVIDIPKGAPGGGNFIVENCSNLSLGSPMNVVGIANTLIVRNSRGSEFTHIASKGVHVTHEIEGVRSGSTWATPNQKLIVAKNSKGELRQWIPADLVDAVDVEEQTIETTEE